MLLSVCIPTFNRPAELTVCVTGFLREIEALGTDQVELVISDNASAPETQALCLEWTRRYPFLRYRRNDENTVAFNFSQAVAMARGEYCWLIGDDDAVPEGVLGPVLEALGSGHDVYLGPRILCDGDLQPVAVQSWYAGSPEPEWDLGPVSERIRYFDQCTGLGGVFGFISVQLFRKAAWDAALPEDTALLRCMYPHIYMLLAMARTSLRLRILPFPVVLGRVPWQGTDPVLRFNSLVFDLEPMLLVARALGYHRQPRLWNAFFGVFRRNHADVHYPRMILLHAPDPASWQRVRPDLIQVGYSEPYLEALEQAHQRVPMGVVPGLELPEGEDPGRLYGMEHLAFLLRGVKAVAVVACGPEPVAPGLLAALRRTCPELDVLLVGPGQGQIKGGFEISAEALEDPAARAQLKAAAAALGVGLAINATWPRTRASDLACAVLPVFGRLALPGPDPVTDPLYTAVLSPAMLEAVAGDSGLALLGALGLEAGAAVAGH